MAIYEAYAPLYDGSGQIRFALLIGHYLKDLLQRHPVAGRRALDVACGTGTLAILLADEGWDVLGVDTSEAMLAQARAKVISMDLPGQAAFVRGDMRSLHEHPGVMPASYDLATCTYDSLNYLQTSAELLACFRGIQQALVPGGLFVGDMNTRHFLEHDWGTCEILEQASYVQVSQSQFDAERVTSTMLLTCFVGDDEQGYQRFDELHVERAYEPEQISTLLREAGFQVEASYDAFTFQPLVERTQRIVWVARRPDTVGRGTLRTEHFLTGDTP